MLRTGIGALLFVWTIAAVGAARADTILAPGDPIVGIHNTFAGGNSTTSTSGTGAGQYPSGEAPEKGIDNSVDTKYLNFGYGTGDNAGFNTGFFVTPAYGASIVTAIRFATANDGNARDPLTITLEGSSATGSDLELGSSWSPIYSGPSGLLNFADSRKAWGDTVNFGNTAAYTSYRLLVTSHRGAANSMQFSEVQFFGSPVPEPSSLLLTGLAAIALFGFIRCRR
jgi:hypothetical protein